MVADAAPSSSLYFSSTRHEKGGIFEGSLPRLMHRYGGINFRNDNEGTNSAPTLLRTRFMRPATPSYTVELGRGEAPMGHTDSWNLVPHGSSDPGHPKYYYMV